MKRVLLVEDDRQYLENLRKYVNEALQMLNLQGEVFVASTYKEAEDQLEDNWPWDLLITDLGLPRLQKQFLGKDLICRAGELNIPSIAVTGYELPPDIENMVTRNSNFILHKGRFFDRDLAINYIASALQGKSYDSSSSDNTPSTLQQKTIMKPHSTPLNPDEFNELTSILASLARSSMMAPSQYFMKLIYQTNWPDKFKHEFNEDQFYKIGDPTRGAQKIIEFSSDKVRYINPFDQKFTTLGSLLHVMFDYVDLENASFISSLIIAYELFRDKSLIDHLRMRYQIPISTCFVDIPGKSFGPDILWQGPEEKELQSWIKPEPELLDVGLLIRAIRCATSVCRVEIPLESPQKILLQGTGVLIAPDLLLTNYHLFQPEGLEIDIQHVALNTCVRFGCFTSETKNESDGQTFHLDSQKPILELSDSDHLDFLLLRIDDQIHAAKDIHPVSWNLHKPLEKNDSVYILQHPEGLAMQLALSRDGITGIYSDNGSLQYVSNTSFGSSGSPCFNSDWELVALHHAQRGRGLYSIREGILFSAIYEKIRNYLD